MMIGPLLLVFVALASALLLLGAPVALFFLPPYAIGAASGLLLGWARGRRARKPRPVVVAGTAGGALGGVLFWALLLTLESTAYRHWHPGRVVDVLVFCGLTVGCGLIAGALGIRLRGALKASRSTPLAESLYFLLAVGAFIGGPLAAGAAGPRASPGDRDFPGAVNVFPAVASSAVVGSVCLFLAFRRCRWPLSIALVLGAGLAGALVSGVLSFLLLATAPEFRGGHGEGGGAAFFFGMAATGTALWVVLAVAFVIGVWHADAAGDRG